MKKFLSIFVLALALLGLVACSECPECNEAGDETCKEFCEECPVNVKELTVSGQKTEFKVGDTFEVGELVVKATLSDDSVVDVAADKYTVEQSADMNVPGTYAVLVKYEGAVVAYQIKVVAEEVVEYATIEEAIAAGAANHDKVATGLVVTNTGETEYGFGANFTYLKNEYEEQYYQLLEDESVFGVSVSKWGEEESASSVYEPTTDNLKGYDFTSLFGYEKTVYGAEDLVAELYSTAKAETSQKFAEKIVKCPDCGANLSYEFSFAAIINGYYELVTVEFALDNEAEFVSEVKVVIEGYYEENYTLNEETNEYEVNEGVFGADFINQVTVSQAAGEKLAENPHGPAKYVYESFDLVKDDVAVEEGANFEVIVGSELVLNVANAKPEGVVAGVDVVNVTITDAEGFETWNVTGSCWDGVVTINPYKPGEYNVVVSTKNVEKSFKLTVTAPELTSFAAGTLNEWYEVVEQSEANIYVNGSVTIAAVVNQYADASFTAELKETSDNATLVQDGTNYVFSATAAGTYEVVLTSSVKAELTATFTVVVAEAPSLAGLLNGTYTFTNGMIGNVTAVFTPESDGAEKGTLVITVAEGYVGDITANFTYEVQGGALVTTPADAGSAMSGVGVELDESMNVCFLYNAWNQGPMTKEGAESNGVEGKYVATMTHPMTGMMLEYILTLNADGTATYDFMNAFYYGTCSYTVVDGAIAFSDFNAMLGTNPISLNDPFLSEGKISATFVCDTDGTSLPLEFIK